MRPIPAPRLGDTHGLLRAINQRERLRLDEFITEFSIDELFPPGLENALGRTRQFVSFARSAGLLKEDRGVVELTEVGKRYVRSGDASAVFDVAPGQAEWLRRQLFERHMTDSIYHGAAIGLSLYASSPEDFHVSRLDFGRALAHLGRAGWDNENTLESQGERYTTFLRDLGLLDEQSRLTDIGDQTRSELTLPVHMSLRDLAGQLNPGGPDAARAEGEAEWAASPNGAAAAEEPAVEEPAPVAEEPAAEEPAADTGEYEDVAGAQAGRSAATESSGRPVVPDDIWDRAAPDEVTRAYSSITPEQAAAAAVDPAASAPAQEEAPAEPAPADPLAGGMTSGDPLAQPPVSVEGPGVESAAPEVAADEPAAYEAEAEAPAVDEPAAHEPAAAAPPAYEPAAEAPPAEEPAAYEPAAEPVAYEPAAEAPAAEEPAAYEPAAEEPAAYEPAAEAPPAGVAEEAPVPVVEVPPELAADEAGAPAEDVTGEATEDAAAEPDDTAADAAAAAALAAGISQAPPGPAEVAAEPVAEVPAEGTFAAGEEAPVGEAPIAPADEAAAAEEAAVADAALAETSGVAPTPTREPSGFLDADALRAAAEDAGLKLPGSVYANLVAALATGKHVIVAGPAGSGKTTLALAIARAAVQGGRSEGAALATASPKWSAEDTVGHVSDAGFTQGRVLAAAGKKKWLVIDELDRAKLDKAFGDLSSFLGGLPLSLPDGSREVAAPKDWRIVATRDSSRGAVKGSAALLRRFAEIRLPRPDAADLEAAVDAATEGDQTAAAAVKRLLADDSLEHLGAGTFLDAARFAAERNAIAPASQDELEREVWAAFIEPQRGDEDDDD